MLLPVKRVSTLHPIPTDPESPEIYRLLDVLYERVGADFRAYAYSSLKRRILTRVAYEETGTIAGLCELIKRDPASLQRLLAALTIHVTAMFRDPGFYATFREKVIPSLRTYPFLRFWVAGCSTGEEVYSLAILLQEEGLYERCRIYATDVNDLVLGKAKNGIFPLAAMQEYTRNYQRSGGRNSFAEYYTADSEFAIFRPALRENIIFAVHNLVGDASFNEFHGIFCRNVMIYFNRDLQERVQKLFFDSLLTFGYLGLGRSETIRFTPHEDAFEEVSARDKLYRKIA
jgi:chemotaxis protein methyltransferase CheR